MLNFTKHTLADATATAATRYISDSLSSFKNTPTFLNPVKLSYDLPRLSPAVLVPEIVPAAAQELFFSRFHSEWRVVNSFNEALIDCLVDIALSKVVGTPLNWSKVTDHGLNQFIRSVVSGYGSKMSANANGRRRPSYTDEFIWGVAGSICGQVAVNLARGEKLDRDVLKRGIIGGFCRTGYGYVRRVVEEGLRAE
ncbi:hypothetical protein SS50377_21809 [Spironucleus salmonicida]|uniref:Uncharacterized protein n=1 Tax=Spironucleus salmonicida TaxID=348837 RepID=V6LLD2_9EUKA|nr:hypothetical protein SS50377_21802 [Spironucleus salmonicida]KAH0576247.1 hypothetical protein SS50377_21809 [Spironucleus salmonicida]|eukprot:EST44803.1 Hypothetical protein SS50377_15312 [Spironucleus salmonicida]